MEIDKEISSVGLLKMERITQQKEKNILLNVPTLKFIYEKEINILTLGNSSTLSTT